MNLQVPREGIWIQRRLPKGQRLALVLTFLNINSQVSGALADESSHHSFVVTAILIAAGLIATEGKAREKIPLAAFQNPLGLHTSLP